MQLSARRLPISLSLTLLCLSVGIFAQQQEMTKEEFEVIISKAERFLGGNAHNVRWTKEVFDLGGSEAISKEVRTKNVAPPNKEHIWYEIISKNDSKKGEVILIGDDVYFRRQGDSWSKVHLPPQFTGVIGRPAGTSFYRYLGASNLSGISVESYSREVIAKKAAEQENADSGSKHTYWIDEQGRYIKRVSEGQDSKGTRTRSAYEYSYAVDFKIEAPIP